MEYDSKVVKYVVSIYVLLLTVIGIESIYIASVNRELDKAKTEIKQQALTIKYLQKDHLVDETL
jgi:uncharacterized membrane protein (DUF485 family)